MTWCHVVLDLPTDQHEAGADFWGRVLGWPAGEPWRDHPELLSFQPPSGSAYVHLQRIDGPPRVHLDVEAEQPQATVARSLELGAEVVATHDEWVTLRSPGGLPFCVIAASQHDPPEAVLLPDGHRVRLVQVCIDSPRAVHGPEVAFWRALLAGRWAPSDGPEFAGKWHDDAGGPVQLLFQQLDETDGPVRAHLDLGTDDLTAEVRRLSALGADDVSAGRGWHVFRDVAGRLFCATSNSPEQTVHRDLG